MSYEPGMMLLFRTTRVGGGFAFSTLYITHCKKCKRGVYKGQDWEWLQEPLGISHSDCLQSAQSRLLSSQDGGQRKS